MKIRLITFATAIILFLVLSTNDSFARKSSYQQSITANPVGLAFGLLNATYEQKLDKTNSFTVNGMYWSFSDWTAFGLGGSYRWYIDLFKTRKKPLEGFSVGPRASLASWNTDFRGYEGGMSISIGGEAAYKWVWDGFVVEAGVILDFPISKPDDMSTLSAFGLLGAIGYAW